MEKALSEQKEKEHSRREHEKKVEQQKIAMKERRQKAVSSQRKNKRKNHSAFLQKQAKYIDQVQKLRFVLEQ